MSDQEPPRPVVFLSPVDFAVERVFPIRNLIRTGLETPEPVQDVEGTKSIEADLQGQAESHADVSLGELEATASPYLPPPYPPIPPESSIRKLTTEDEQSNVSTMSGEGDGQRRTERAQLVPATSGPPGVLPGAVSETAGGTFYRCEDEPIHTPGAIQQYGALVALRFDANRNLLVRIASENSRQILHYGPEQLFQLESFLLILAPEDRDDMVARIQNALHNASLPGALLEDTHLDVFPVSILLADGAQHRLWCAVHVAKGTQDLIICEFEEYSDVFYLHDIQEEGSLPKTPTSTIGLEVLPEERLKSTIRGSKPLKVLEIARRKQHSGVSSMDIFNAMTQAQAQLASAKSTQQVMDIVIGIIAELTGFHRVMFYRFDNQKNGCVEAEFVNPKASEDLFRGKDLFYHFRRTWDQHAVLLEKQLSMKRILNIIFRSQFSSIGYSNPGQRAIQNQPDSDSLRSGRGNSSTCELNIPYRICLCSFSRTDIASGLP